MERTEIYKYSKTTETNAFRVYFYERFGQQSKLYIRSWRIPFRENEINIPFRIKVTFSNIEDDEIEITEEQCQANHILRELDISNNVILESDHTQTKRFDTFTNSRPFNSIYIPKIILADLKNPHRLNIKIEWM